MAYDETLAERIRQKVGHRKGISEKKMFGGIAFLLDGHMFAGVSDDSLMARVGRDSWESALGKEHVREMDFTGKSLRGYVFVDPKGLEDDAALESWLDQCAAFAMTLPSKRK